MKRSQVSRIKNEADAQIVAGVWLISCLDDNPGVLYASAARRLRTDRQTVMRVVDEWRELFRPGISIHDKNRDRSGRLRSSIQEDPEFLSLENLADFDRATWNKHCFRSQYRRALSSERSKPDEIRTGLDYIEANRKAYLEFSETRRAERIYLAPLVTIAVTLILGVLALSANYVVASRSAHEAKRANDLKQQEISMVAGTRPTSPTILSAPSK